MDILAYGEAKSIDQRSTWQKFMDFIRPSFLGETDERKIAAVSGRLKTSEKPQDQRTGADFVMDVLNFSQILTNKTEKNDFLGSVRLHLPKQENRDRSTQVVFYLNDSNPAHMKPMSFKQEFILPDCLFEVESESELGSTFKLKQHVLDSQALGSYQAFLGLFEGDACNKAIKIINDLPKASTKAHFQHSMLELEKIVADEQKECFYTNFQFQIEQNNGTSVTQVFFLNGADNLNIAMCNVDKKFRPSKELFQVNSAAGLSYKLQPDTFRDFFNLFDESDYRQVVDIVSDLTKPNGSLAFEHTILKLEKLVTKDQKARFYRHFRLEVTEESGVSYAQVSFLASPIAMSQFEGKLIPNDRLFMALKANPADQTSQTFALREINNNNNLRLPLDVKLDPAIRTGLEHVCEKVVNTSITENQFDEMMRNMHKTILMLFDFPKEEDVITQQKSNGLVPDFSRGEDIFTQQKCKQLILRCFNNAAELKALEPAEWTFYEKFMAVSTDVKMSFLMQIDKLECAKTTTGLLDEFLTFDTEQQTRLKKTFFGVADNFRFYGTLQQFKAKFGALSNEEQALLVIALDQTYKTPLQILGLHISGLGPSDDQLAVCPSPFKIKPVRSPHADRVRMEVQKRNNFKHNEDSSQKPKILAHEDVSTFYSVSFKKDQELVGAGVELYGSKSSLVIHSKNGAIPVDHKSTSMVSAATSVMFDEIDRNEKVENELEFTLGQLHRSQMLSQVSIAAS